VIVPILLDMRHEHPDNRWGELSEREGNIVARQMGLVARSVIRGAGDLAASSEHLH
jgi:hypothetical protein